MIYFFEGGFGAVFFTKRGAVCVTLRTLTLAMLVCPLQFSSRYSLFCLIHSLAITYLKEQKTEHRRVSKRNDNNLASVH